MTIQLEEVRNAIWIIEQYIKEQNPLMTSSVAREKKTQNTLATDKQKNLIIDYIKDFPSTETPDLNTLTSLDASNWIKTHIQADYINARKSRLYGKPQI